MNQSKTLDFSPARAAIGSLIAAVSLLAGCGGGGGVSSPTPDFERVSVNGVDGVRDNRTTIVWARTLGDPNLRGARFPSAAELLGLLEGTDNAVIQSYFGSTLAAAPSAKFRVSEPNYADLAAVWTVDVGGVAARGAVSADPAANSASTWYVLQPDTATIAPVRYVPYLNRGLLWPDTGPSRTALMWKMCAEGSTWDSPSATCKGSPGLYDATTAQAAVDSANATSFGGFNDWRLPTKQELQSLLKLESFQRPLVLDAFVRAYDQGTPWNKGFRTRSQSGSGYTWGVHFDTGEVGPFVLPTDQMSLRLVRDAR